MCPTASTKSPAAALKAEMTCGVITLLVGSLILSGSTSTGSRVNVKARRRFTSSSSELAGEDRGGNRKVPTSKCVWRGFNRFDGH